MSRQLEPFAILRTLVDRRVNFVIIGGFGAGLHGSPALTGDLDICYDRHPDNLERLANALADLHATLRVADREDGVPAHLDALALQHGDSFTLWTDRGPFDIIGTPSGTRGFDDLYPAAERFDVGEGLVVPVASIDDLIRMKRSSGREKDAAHIAALEVVREERER